MSIITTALGGIQNCSSPVAFKGAAPSEIASSTQPPTVPPGYTTTSQKFSFGSGVSGSTVDILIIDDNSGSMQQNQKNLANGFAQFISGLAGSDWQIAVTTTDINAEAGRFVGPADQAGTLPYSRSYMLTPNTPNVATLFSETIQRTTSAGVYLDGAGDERAIYAANLTINGYNDPNVAQGFFRPDAALAIVILSNEDERSCGNDPTCHNDPANASQYQPFAPLDYPNALAANITKTFGANKQYSINAIVVKPGDTQCFADENRGGIYDSGGNYGVVFASAATMTGGIVASICDNGTGQYAQSLAAISQVIRNTTQPTLTLDHVPVAMPQVTFVPAQPTITYTWAAGTTKVILSAYPANSQVTVTYQY